MSGGFWRGVGVGWRGKGGAVNDFLLVGCFFVEARGHQIKAGDIVITGAMSGLLPAEPGTYEVNYGEFGTIGFEIVA